MMSRVMPLDESTRVNMMYHAQRGFRTIRGPENLATVCEIAALSSTDPTFIAHILGQVPDPTEHLPQWLISTIDTDHEVMMAVLADRFGVDWRTVNIFDSKMADGSVRHLSAMEAIVEKDNVRMLATGVERGWFDLHERWVDDRWSLPDQHGGLPWLAHALRHLSSNIAETLFASPVIRHDANHLLGALDILSVGALSRNRDEHEFQKRWWATLIGAGVNPWELDRNHRHENKDSSQQTGQDGVGTTPAHRLLLEVLSLAGNDFTKSLGRDWLNHLNTTLNWSDAPMINEQSLADVAFAHPLFTRVVDRDAFGLNAMTGSPLLQTFMVQGVTFQPQSPAWSSATNLLLNMRERFEASSGFLQPILDAHPEGLLSGAHMEHLANRLMSSFELRHWNHISDPAGVQERSDQWHQRVSIMDQRLTELDPLVTVADRPAWQGWRQLWSSTWSEWANVPKDEQERFKTSRVDAVALRTSLLSHNAPLEAPRPRVRL